MSTEHPDIENCYEKFFRKGAVSEELRLQWLEAACEAADGGQIEYGVQEITDVDGNPGYRFIFPNTISFAVFAHNMGDAINDGQDFVRVEYFDPGNSKYAKWYFTAAQALLTERKIFHMIMDEAECKFGFITLYEQLYFRALIENGSLERTARDIDETVRGILGAAPDQTFSWLPPLNMN